MPAVCQPAPVWGTRTAAAVLNGPAGAWVGRVNRSAAARGIVGQSLCMYQLRGALTLTYAALPDDDTRITVDGRVVHDPRRNMGWYDGLAPIVLNADLCGIVHGSRVFLDIFDGWGGGWRTRPWNATVHWSDGMVSHYAGGSTVSGVSPYPVPNPVGDYHARPPAFELYLPNGNFTATHPGLVPVAL